MPPEGSPHEDGPGAAVGAATDEPVPVGEAPDVDRWPSTDDPAEGADAESPGADAESPGLESPGAESADTQSPDTASPGTELPGAQVPTEATAPERSADDERVVPAPAEAPAVVAPEPRPPTMVRRTVSAEIARQLHGSGARFCFTVPGESFLPLIDDLAAVGIRVVTTRHESGAAFMAEALAQSTGRPQIVAVSRAVGASNAAIGIHTAAADSAPLVALVGQVERGFLGREAFQEADLVRSIGSLAAWATQIDEADQTATIMAKAQRRLGTGRPGPILIAVPQDVQAIEIEVPDAPVSAGQEARGPAADRTAVSRVVKLLAGSERGVIVAGGGVLRARATKRLVALSEALAVPVMAAWRRPDVFPNDHPNYLGMAGIWSAPTVRQRLEDADVIVFIGARLSEVNTFDFSIPGSQTRWAHVDVQPRPAHAGLSAPTISVEADASRFLDAAWSDLRAAALDNEMRSRREARNAADREAYRSASQVGQGSWDGPGVHPGRIVAMLRRVLPDNAVITTDAGNMGGWVARGYRFRRPGTFIGATSGAMGFGLPAAIAASLQDPGRIAVAICGDGGFAMTMMEIETAVREGAHPVVLVFDNERYGTIASSQASAGRATASSELGAVDFAAIARCQGALGFSVSDDAGFEMVLRDAISSRQTSVLHVRLDRAWVSVDDNPVAAIG